MSRMTVDLLCKCTGQTRRKREETKEQFLGRVTHLYCAEKEIRRVVSGGVCLDRFRLNTKTERLRGITHLLKLPSATSALLCCCACRVVSFGVCNTYI